MLFKVCNIKEKELLVTPLREKECSLCGQIEGCGLPILGFFHRRKFHVPNKINAQIGDVITVNMTEDSLLKAVALVYGLPLLGVLSGGILGSILGGQQDRDILLGVIVGFLLILPIRKWLSNRYDLAMFTSSVDQNQDTSSISTPSIKETDDLVPNKTDNNYSK